MYLRYICTLNITNVTYYDYMQLSNQKLFPFVFVFSSFFVFLFSLLFFSFIAGFLCNLLSFLSTIIFCSFRHDIVVSCFAFCFHVWNLSGFVVKYLTFSLSLSLSLSLALMQVRHLFSQMYSKIYLFLPRASTAYVHSYTHNFIPSVNHVIVN